MPTVSPSAAVALPAAAAIDGGGRRLWIGGRAVTCALRAGKRLVRFVVLSKWVWYPKRSHDIVSFWEDY
jgi:hypothetical protein